MHSDGKEQGMIKLERESMSRFIALLPDDAARALGPLAAGGDAAAEEIAAKAPALGNSELLLNFVDTNADKFLEIGRPRRMRFLAWYLARGYGDKVEKMRFMTALTDEGDGEASGGREKVAPVFREDIRAFVEALAPRAARAIVDHQTLTAVANAGYEVSGELEMRGGTR